MALKDWSTTAADNDSASPDGAPEGMLPGGLNNTIREIMAQVRGWYEDPQWVNLGHVPTRIDNDTFTVPTDLTATYHAGRRLKLTGSATGYCTIASTSYSAPDTTVNVTMDSGNIPGTLSAVYISILTSTNTAIPGSSILASLLTVDGAGSGLDADLLDGQSGAFYAPASTAALQSITISVSGTGLSGGGSLAANRTITIDQTAMTTRNITGKAGIAKTLSTSAASGGSDGDIWYRY